MNARVTPIEHPKPQDFGVDRSWHAKIALDFRARSDKTILDDMRFKGPLRVQRPFYPEGAPCHVYLLHPPGGMVSGDTIDIALNISKGAHALITTPSAGKVYGADSCNVVQAQNIVINNDEGIAEWLPQENILFNGANARLNTEVNLSENAQFMGWDMLGFGRPKGEYFFNSGQLRQSLRIVKNGVPIVIESFTLDKELSLLRSTVGYMGFSYVGNFYIVSNSPKKVVDEIRCILPEVTKQLVVAVTHKPGIVIVRGFSHCAETLRNQFIEIWKCSRNTVLGRPACVPRIWST